jgi:hypothetical protein
MVFVGAGVSICVCFFVDVGVGVPSEERLHRYDRHQVLIKEGLLASITAVADQNDLVQGRAFCIVDERGYANNTACYYCFTFHATVDLGALVYLENGA